MTSQNPTGIVPASETSSGTLADFNSTDIVIRLVGESGEGTVSLGDLMVQMLTEMGLDIYTFQTFPAEIKGGTVMYQIRVKSGEILSHGDAVDLLVALNSTSAGAAIAVKRVAARGDDAAGHRRAAEDRRHEQVAPALRRRLCIRHASQARHGRSVDGLDRSEESARARNGRDAARLGRHAPRDHGHRGVQGLNPRTHTRSYFAVFPSSLQRFRRCVSSGLRLSNGNSAARFKSDCADQDQKQKRRMQDQLQTATTSGPHDAPYIFWRD